MKKLLASLLFAIPTLSMSLYGATIESPQGASHHRHHHHDCSSSEEQVGRDPQFGFFYLTEEQFLDDGEFINWNANNGTHTNGVTLAVTETPTITDIVIAERGLYLVTWVLTVATDPTLPFNGATQFQLVLNGLDVAGGNYATTVPQFAPEVLMPTQLFGQSIITVINSNSLLSLRNDSDKTVELVADVIQEEAEGPTTLFNVSASIVIQKLTDI